MENYNSQIEFIYKQMNSIEAKTNSKYMKELIEAYHIYILAQKELSESEYVYVYVF